MVNIISRQVLICNNTITSIFQDTVNYFIFLKIGSAANSYIMELDTSVLLLLVFTTTDEAGKR